MVVLKNIFLLASTAAAAAIVSRDAITVESDLTLIVAPQIMALNIYLYGFPITGLNSSSAVHNAASRLASSLNTVAHDVTNVGQLDILDGTVILSEFQALVPVYLNILTEYVSKKAEFAAVSGGPAQALGDLRALNTSTITFGEKLVTAEPLSLKAGAISSTAELGKSFAAAIAAFDY